MASTYYNISYQPDSSSSSSSSNSDSVRDQPNRYQSTDDRVLSSTNERSVSLDEIHRQHQLDLEQNCRRYRTAFTREQVLRLETVFARESYISKPKRMELAKELKLRETTIKVWFQNRRMKDKRQRHNFGLFPLYTDPVLMQLIQMATSKIPYLPPYVANHSYQPPSYQNNVTNPWRMGNPPFLFPTPSYVNMENQQRHSPLPRYQSPCAQGQSVQKFVNTRLNPCAPTPEYPNPDANAQSIDFRHAKVTPPGKLGESLFRPYDLINKMANLTSPYFES